MSGRFFTFITSIYIVIGVILYDLNIFTSIDELFPIFLFICVLIQSFAKSNIINKPFLFWISISIFYVIYSLIIKSNSVPAIINDYLIQIKPYLTLFCILALKPYLREKDKRWLRQLSVISAISLIIIFFIFPRTLNTTTNGEILSGARFASAAYLIGILYFSLGKGSKKQKLITILIISIGWLLPTSKYVGVYLGSIFLLIFIKAPIKINVKTIILGALIIFLVVYSVFDDISFYFIGGVDNGIERALLYGTAPTIIKDYFPFGSGLASYGTSASANYYSDIYIQYGLDNYWGLSPLSKGAYVSDAFYPSLAQFGLVGIILFVIFWIYIYKLIMSQFKRTTNLMQYKGAILIVFYILVESIADSTFIQNRGVLAMIILSLNLYDRNEYTNS